MKAHEREPCVGHTMSISVECADCGRNRWWKPVQLKRFGVDSSTPLSSLSARLTCKACRDEGMPGKTVTISAAFSSELERERASAYLINSREALVEGSRAIRA